MITNNGLRFLTACTMGYELPKNYSSDTNGFLFTSPVGEVINTSTVIPYSFTKITKDFPFVHTYGNELINDTDSTPVANLQHTPIIFCGTGTTQPTREDIKLENCISELKRQSTSTSCELGKIHINVVFNNPTENEITVNELGLYKLLINVSPSTTNLKISFADYGILIARRVLNEPIVVQAGETFSINYTIDFTTMTD
jgi:hypothetical protein